MGRFFRLIFLGAAAGALVYLFWLPDVGELKNHNPRRTALMDLREAQAAAAGHRTHPVLLWRPLEQISPHLIHAVLVSEDDTFFQHSGFDLEQIRIAILRDWEKKRFVYGGSTLTQQLARTLYLSPRKNLLRKAKEAILTIVLEHTLSKRRILELYLNVVEWGRGTYGAEAAAQHYFQIPAKDLSPDQAVALASILPSPRRWSPLSERSFMARRRLQLTERMQQSGYWPVSVDTTTNVPINGEELLVPDAIPPQP